MKASEFGVVLATCLGVFAGGLDTREVLRDTTPAPVFALAFDENEGLTVQDRAGGVTGRLAEGDWGPAWVQGVREGALWFSGKADEVVTFPHDDRLNVVDELTLSAWIWPKQFGGFQMIVERR